MIGMKWIAIEDFKSNHQTKKKKKKKKKNWGYLYTK